MLQDAQAEGKGRLSWLKAQAVDIRIVLAKESDDSLAESCCIALSIFSELQQQLEFCECLEQLRLSLSKCKKSTQGPHHEFRFARRSL